MNILNNSLKLLLLISLLFSYPAIAAKLTWRNPLPQGNLLNSVSCSTANFCVAVGNNGTVLSSTDGGINWTIQSANTTENLLDINCPTENLCVAVGDHGIILTSIDGGISWILRSVGTTNDLHGISCSSENLCVAVGRSSTILTTTDGGINWNLQPTDTNNVLLDVSCPTENRCVAVGTAGIVMVLTSTDRGINWNRQSISIKYDQLDIINQLNDISCFTENVCVILKYNGSVLTSIDGGINWTQQSAGINSWLASINCLNHHCIIVGESGSILTTDNITYINNTKPLVTTDISPINGKIGDIFSLNLADYFEDPEDGDNLTYTILGDYNVVTVDPSQLPQLNLTLVAEGSEDVTLRVTDSQGWLIEYAFKVSVENVPTVCEPASYSNQTQQANLPALEIPFSRSFLTFSIL